MMSLMLMAALAVVPQPQAFRISRRTLPAEGYRIRIDAAGKAEVEAADEAGRYYANVTLGQLKGAKGPLEIEDWPRYSWRGVMLDESRFFFGKETVKAVLDEMARHKLNVFHWHLTDDQGWRLDVPGLPEIARKGAVRAHSWKPFTEDESDGTPYGPHFYTADDIREVVAYACARHIRVVPEIELPGHVSALLASHPEFSCEGVLQPAKMPKCEVGISDIVLCAGNDEAIRFMERVLDEVTKLFPDGCVHIGGDECPKAKWKACAKCQARMKALGLKDENALQAWLTRHFVGYLKSKGRRVVGWDEILEGGELDPSAIVQCWRPAGWAGTGGTVAETPGGVAVGRGHDIIVSPVDVTYFSVPWAKDGNRICWRRPLDSYGEDELATVEKLRAFDPAAAAGTTNLVHVLGAEGCNWTEGTRDAATLKAKMWPRTAILAQVLWTGASRGGFAGCSRERTENARIATAADLKGRHVAHMSSDFHKKELMALEPGIVFDPYSEFSFAIESLRGGKIDAISLGRTYADIWMAKFPGEFRVAFDYADDVIAFLLPKGSSLKPRLDAEIRKMNAAGETVAIARKWIEGAKKGTPPVMPEHKPPPLGAPEVRIACAAQIEPWCFVSNGEVSGAEIEILSVIAQRLGWNLKPKIFSWGGMVDCVNAGRCEIANGGIYTNGELFPTVDASEKYADEKMCILVRNEDFEGGGAGPAAFAKSLKESFVRTFVTENRWKMLADGLGVTLFITVLSVALATLLAFPVWRARTASNAFVSACAKGYIAFMQGTPLLVFLMVLFYIVFGKVDIAGIWVAVIGFSLNASAYLGEVLRSGIESVPRGQAEAALALGYTPRRTFFRFVLPQAVRTVLPVYRGQVVILLKNTSIVGYIAIGDLTKASDLVRSRTYESFFPILTTAFVYFAVAWLLARLLDRAGRRLDPAFGRHVPGEGKST